MVGRLISNVRFRITIIVYTTYINKQRHGIIAGVFYSKWGIVLEKSKRTLQSTTQDNVRSAMKPLTWR